MAEDVADNVANLRRWDVLKTSVTVAAQDDRWGSGQVQVFADRLMTPSLIFLEQAHAKYSVGCLV